MWQHRWLRWLLTAGLFIAIVIGLGCSSESRQKIKTIVFEDVPPTGQKITPAPYVRKPRRPPPYKPPARAPHKFIAYEAEFQNDWSAIWLKLPKDTTGGIDWVTALEQGDIDPQAGIDPKTAQAQPVFPLDVELEPANMPMFKVIFPHKQHTEWLACTSCHTKIFQMKAGADPITMTKIYAGKYCGECHGKVAFNVPTGCPRCHRALAGPQ